MEIRADLSSIAEDFDFFWSHWPKKTGKREAKQVWAKLSHEQRLKVLEVLGIWAQASEGKTGKD